MREIAEVRMTFLPYLYSCFRHYRTEGLPPVRSLLLDFPDDPALRAVDDQFLFGDNIMVAPFKGDPAAREVYFPQGVDWYDFRTGEKHAGGSKTEVKGTPGDTPLFARANTLLPVAKSVEYVAADTVFDITVHVFGDAPEEFVLFEDDGETFDYEQGSYNLVTLSWEDGKGSQSRDGQYSETRYRIKDWKEAGRSK
jgi:alpha-D-xyloside xylohydrolase